MADLAIHPIEVPLIEGNPSLGQLTETVSNIVERKVHPNWYIALAVTGSITGIMGLMLTKLQQYEQANLPPSSL